MMHCANVMKSVPRLYKQRADEELIQTEDITLFQVSQSVLEALEPLFDSAQMLYRQKCFCSAHQVNAVA